MSLFVCLSVILWDLEVLMHLKIELYILRNDRAMAMSSLEKEILPFGQSLIFRCVSTSRSHKITDKQTNRHLALFSLVWQCMTLYDYVWLYMTLCAYVRLCTTMYNYVWLCMTMYDYVKLCMTMHDYIWLFNKTMYDKLFSGLLKNIQTHNVWIKICKYIYKTV